MPCEIGQNIYKLRKKNKELLDLLESNSALLEKKIKMLRQATRSPTKSDVKKDLPSPLKRRHECSDRGKNFGYVAADLIKCGTHRNPDPTFSSNENIPEKLCMKGVKKIPTKRVKHTVLKTEVRKQVERQAKSKKPIREERLPTCYHVKLKENRDQQACKSETDEKKFKNKRSSENSIKRLKEPMHDSHVSHDSVIISENESEELMPDVCSKCLNEINLLHYSPESVFLQRMKQRLQKLVSESTNKNHSKIHAVCNCEVNILSDEESNHSCSAVADPLINAPLNSNQTYTEKSKEWCQIHSLVTECDNEKLCRCLSNEIAHKDAQIQPSRQITDTFSENVPPRSVQLLRKKSSNRNQTSAKIRGCKTQNCILKRVSSGKNSDSAAQHKWCLCKKQDGGLCCCEVERSPNKIPDAVSSNGVASFPTPFKSSVSAPVFPILKTKEKPVSRDINSGTCESKAEGKKFSMLNGIQPAGHDVIDGQVQNDHDKYISDPCTYHIEELSHFRQKHWFDCHAHPHGATVSEVCSGVKECHNQTSTFDDDLMQPTLDPCVRSYRLNHRLFPETTREKHSAGCCTTGQGGCVTSRLLPTQRRLITLPTFPQHYVKEVSDTMKPPPGVHAFPESSILICDPVPMEKSRSTSATTRRHRQPVPSNSLALRFQKGVA